jgi:hypothetical protein
MIEYLLCILCGALVKLADEFADSRRFRKYGISGYAVGILYGIAGGILFSQSPAIATAVLAVMIAVILAGKEDHPIHYAAMLAFIATALYFGMQQPYAIPLAVFVAAAFADERMSDKASLGKIRNSFLQEFFSARMILDVAAIAVSIALSEPAYAFAIIGFDAGYQAVAYAAKSNN